MEKLKSKTNQRSGFTKDFYLVVIGQIISLFGNAVLRFALPIHLLNVTGSAAILGIVSGCAFLPVVVMAPIGGSIADRVNKRNIMVILDFITAGLTFLFLILYGKLNATGMILVFMFVLYGISGAYQPSVQASIPVLVEKDKVMTANAMINMVSSLSGLLGPALGGIAYSIWGIYPILAGASVCFLASAVMEIFIHIPYEKRPRTESVFRETKKDLVQSISYITKFKPEISKLTLCVAGVNLVLSSLLIIGLPVVVMQSLSFSESEASRLYGFMQAFLAVGGLCGGICAGIMGKHLKVSKSWKLLLVGGSLLLPMGIVLMLDVSPYVAYVVLVVAGMMIMAVASIYSIQIMSYIQVTVPVEMVGKVIAWVIALATCAQPAGQIVYGILFEQVSGSVFKIFYGAAVISSGIAWYSSKSAKKLN